MEEQTSNANGSSIRKMIELKRTDFDSVSTLWAETMAWRHLPRPFPNINVMYNIKKDTGFVFLFSSDFDKFAKSVQNIESDGSKASIILELVDKCKKDYDSAMQAAKDLSEIDLESLPAESIYKIYSILLNQYSELAKPLFIYYLLSAVKSDMAFELESVLKDKGLEVKIIEYSLKQLFGSKIFEELSKRSYKSKKEIMLMSPEEIHNSIYGGVFEEWELENRKDHFIMVYDLEKDGPIIYSGEKSRVMEVSLNIRI